MTQQELKKLKYYKGWKINHPHSFVNFFFMIWELLAIAVPVMLLFLPLMRFPMGGEIVALTGLDQIKIGIGLLTSGFDQSTTGLIGDYLSIGAVESGAPNLLSQYYHFVLAGQAGLLALMLLNALFIFIIFLVHLIKGFVRHTWWVKFFSVLNLDLTILFIVSYLALYAGNIAWNTSSELFIWFTFIPLGALIFINVVIHEMRLDHFYKVLQEKDLVIVDGEPEQVVNGKGEPTPIAPNPEPVKEEPKAAKPEPVVAMPTKDETPEIRPVVPVDDSQKAARDIVNPERNEEKIKPENLLPQDITEIPDRAYDKNQDLIIANIPHGVTSLGLSAFANCLHLKVVSIPKTVKEIKANCFFNCTSLSRLNFAGTKEEWRHIKRGSHWLDKAKTTEVICVDGPIVVNPLH